MMEIQLDLMVAIIANLNVKKNVKLVFMDNAQFVLQVTLFKKL